jgi:hypothetical protein
MQSSMAVAGMDALSESCENILTRRANQRHYCIIAQFAKRPWPCPTTGSSARLQARNPYPQLKLHRLATAKGRPARCRAARACHARAPRRYSEAQSGTGLHTAIPHVAEPFIGPRFARTRWLMRATCCFSSSRGERSTTPCAALIGVRLPRSGVPPIKHG